MSEKMSEIYILLIFVWFAVLWAITKIYDVHREIKEIKKSIKETK